MEDNKKSIMTNLGYCLSLTINDIALVNRVIRTFIAKRVGADAPIWEREKAYNEWCSRSYEDDYSAWETARKEMTMSKQTHTGLMNFDFQS